MSESSGRQRQLVMVMAGIWYEQQKVLSEEADIAQAFPALYRMFKKC